MSSLLRTADFAARSLVAEGWDLNPIVKELRAAYDRLAAQAIPPKAQPKPADFKAPAVWGER